MAGSALVDRVNNLVSEHRYPKGSDIPTSERGSNGNVPLSVHPYLTTISLLETINQAIIKCNGEVQYRSFGRLSDLEFELGDNYRISLVLNQDGYEIHIKEKNRVGYSSSYTKIILDGSFNVQEGINMQIQGGRNHLLQHFKEGNENRDNILRRMLQKFKPLNKSTQNKDIQDTYQRIADSVMSCTLVPSQRYVN